MGDQGSLEQEVRGEEKRNRDVGVFEENWSYVVTDRAPEGRTEGHPLPSCSPPCPRLLSCREGHTTF